MQKAVPRARGRGNRLDNPSPDLPKSCHCRPSILPAAFCFQGHRSFPIVLSPQPSFLPHKHHYFPSFPTPSFCPPASFFRSEISVSPCFFFFSFSSFSLLHLFWVKIGKPESSKISGLSSRKTAAWAAAWAPIERMRKWIIGSLWKIGSRAPLWWVG